MESEMSIPMRQNVTALATSQPSATAIEDVLIKGDLSKLNEGQRTEYYMRLCQSIGLNPMTQPFQYLTLNGKLVLYARRDCADQLRKINGISIEIVSQDKSDGLLTVHADEDLGVVSFPETLKGEAAANATLKAVTKAKRRVTLSLSGLGFLDETEVQDIPASAKQIVEQTGEVISADELDSLIMLCEEVGADREKFAKYLKVPTLADLPAHLYDRAVAALEAKRSK
jgi:hypothetical protein